MAQSVLLDNYPFVTNGDHAFALSQEEENQCLYYNLNNDSFKFQAFDLDESFFSLSHFSPFNGIDATKYIPYKYWHLARSYFDPTTHGVSVVSNDFHAQIVLENPQMFQSLDIPRPWLQGKSYCGFEKELVCFVNVNNSEAYLKSMHTQQEEYQADYFTAPLMDVIEQKIQTCIVDTKNNRSIVRYVMLGMLLAHTQIVRLVEKQKPLLFIFFAESGNNNNNSNIADIIICLFSANFIAAIFYRPNECITTLFEQTKYSIASLILSICQLPWPELPSSFSRTQLITTANTCLNQDFTKTLLQVTKLFYGSGDKCYSQSPSRFSKLMEPPKVLFPPFLFADREHTTLGSTCEAAEQLLFFRQQKELQQKQKELQQKQKELQQKEEQEQKQQKQQKQTKQTKRKQQEDADIYHVAKKK